MKSQALKERKNQRQLEKENFNKSKEANLGKVALIHIITNMIKEALKISQNDCSKYIKTCDNAEFPKM